MIKYELRVVSNKHECWRAELSFGEGQVRPTKRYINLYYYGRRWVTLSFSWLKVILTFNYMRVT